MNELDDQIREIVERYVEPDKRGDAIKAIRTLKSDTISFVMNKVNMYNESLNAELGINGKTNS